MEGFFVEGWRSESDKDGRGDVNKLKKRKDWNGIMKKNCFCFLCFFYPFLFYYTMAM